ncbi:hypothetical protein GCM10025864_39210 [Luteimicrobium album]|uniref:Uncharacterized protein n=1 Tax=Luteimicrobium album TaxID=1054550 RepID=A0ABQ6I7G1_9MICO|nr:hypothetical protein [Luteimicrobium album]GMA26162.1 hypothetical protein GCM10025864_39210 [Luteimicrobium album]
MKHHYPLDDALHDEREEARDAAYDADWTLPPVGLSELPPEPWEFGEDG